MRISDWSSDVCSSDLPPAVLNDVAALARTRPLPRGLRIFDQGELAGRAHALLSGGVRITQSGSDGEEILVRFIGPSEIFGCVPVLTDGLYPADATAIVDANELSCGSEERSVGEEWVCSCRSRWSPDHYKKTQ